MVPGKRLELLSLSALASKTSVYTNSTTQAKLVKLLTNFTSLIALCTKEMLV